MNTHITLGGLLLGGLLALTLSARSATTAPEAASLLVGTFDSRAVAMAYVRSDDFSDYLRAQKADIERARERARTIGDAALAAELDALGPAMQQRVHRQGFGTAPVDDILVRIQDRLPDIAAEAGVDLIVSKWSLTWRDEEATCLDVTNLLAAEFEPDEATWQVIRDIVATEPVPLEQLKQDH